MLQRLSSFCDRSAAGITQRQKCGYNLLTNPASVIRVHVCYCKMISGRSLAESRKVWHGVIAKAPVVATLTWCVIPLLLGPKYVLTCPLNTFSRLCYWKCWTREVHFASAKRVHPPTVFWDPRRIVQLRERRIKTNCPVSVTWELKPSLTGRACNGEQEHSSCCISCFRVLHRLPSWPVFHFSLPLKQAVSKQTWYWKPKEIITDSN